MYLGSNCWLRLEWLDFPTWSIIGLPLSCLSPVKRLSSQRFWSVIPPSPAKVRLPEHSLIEADFYPLCLHSSRSFVLEAAGRRNELEWCWWQVKINPCTHIENRGLQSCVSQPVALNAEHDTGPLSAAVYSTCCLSITADGRPDTKPQPIEMSEWMGAQQGHSRWSWMTGRLS